MPWLTRLPLLLLLCVAAAPPHQGPPVEAAPLPAATLSVHADGEWVEWWRSAEAPARWAGPLDGVLDAVSWRRVREGLESGEVLLAGQGFAWRTRVVLVRLEPSRFWFRLEQLQVPGGAGAWTVADAPPEAALALNAGQFFADGPWGWVVREGHEVQWPGMGPLSLGIAFKAAGSVEWLSPTGIERVRPALAGVNAFQSYPVLLWDGGVVPEPLTGGGLGVDVAHRDIRLALCELHDGRLLIALTRFHALGGVLETLPFGLSTPETAALMGALGCRVAVLLDGGVSAQLMVRDPAGRPTYWRGWRRVPLGLIAVPRTDPLR